MEDLEIALMNLSKLELSSLYTLAWNLFFHIRQVFGILPIIQTDAKLS